MQASAAKIPPQVVGSESIISAKPNDRLALDLDDIVSGIFLEDFAGTFCVRPCVFLFDPGSASREMPGAAR
jgi:hypothetical protein